MFHEIKDKLKRLGTERLASLALLAIACTFAAQKGVVTYPRTDPDTAYLTDAGSSVDEEALHLLFTAGSSVPVSANILVSGKMISPPGNDWVTQWQFMLSEITMTGGVYHTDLQYPNATNYNWMVYTDWTPGTSVVTNGVWYIRWGNDFRGRGLVIPLNTKVVVDGETLAPPNRVKKEKQNETD